MSCACENSRMAKEKERVLRLAKALAVLEQSTVAVYANADGTYGFEVYGDIAEGLNVIELVTPY